jgi:fructosamine-3-kinase
VKRPFEASKSARLAVAILTVVAVMGSGCGGAIRADELSRSVDSLVSSASEGQLLAEGVAADRTKATFVRVRARELGETVDHEGEKLNDASAKPELAAEKKAAVGLAEHISSALGQLQLAPTDESAATRVGKSLARLATHGEQLSESL